VPPSPYIELLPEIKASSSDDKASEWLRRGNGNCGTGVEQGGSGVLVKLETYQVLDANQQEEVGWDWNAGKMDIGDSSPTIIESREE
jgi:hypothetical protein